MPSLIQVMSVVALLIIGILAYRVILLISEVKSRRRFVLKSFLKEELEEQSKTYSLLERVTSLEKYRTHIETKIKEAKVEQSFESFMTKRIIITSLCVAYMVGMGFFFDLSLFYYLAVPFAVLTFSIPMKQLNRKKENYYKQLRSEIPSYLKSFGVLLNDRTPMDAVQSSIDYAGVYLRPYVVTLITEIELYPTDGRPYHNFSKGVKVREAQEFMIAFQQMMTVNSDDAAFIIDHQIEIINQLQQETYKEEAEYQTSILNNFIMSMMLPFIVVIMSFLMIMIKTQFNSIVTQ